MYMYILCIHEHIYIYIYIYTHKVMSAGRTSVRAPPRRLEKRSSEIAIINNRYHYSNGYY